MKYSFLISRKNKQPIFLNVDINTTTKYESSEESIKHIHKIATSNVEVVSDPTKISGKLVGFKNKKPVFTQDTLKKFSKKTKLVTVIAVIGENKEGFIICNDSGEVVSVSANELKLMRKGGYSFTNISEDLKLSLKGFEEGKDIPILKTVKKSVIVGTKLENYDSLTKKEMLKIVSDCIPVNALQYINNNDWYSLVNIWKTNLVKVKDRFSHSGIAFDKILVNINKVQMEAANVENFKEQVLEVFTNKKYTMDNIKL